MFKIRKQHDAILHKCAHCGDDCPVDHPVKEELQFCCNGCLVIFMVLKENGLGDYYSFDINPGISQRSQFKKDYKYLDDEDVVNNLLDFKEDKLCKITFTLPQIHCASCIWLLENLGKLNAGIVSSRVDFLKKIATVGYNPTIISLRQVVEQLSVIGYPPELNLQKLTESKSGINNRTIYYKLGLAGFSFGNIMLLSFPEYLGFAQATIQFYLGYINIFLAIPVLLYSGFDYLRSAYWTIKMRHVNIDIPIAVGMLTLFFRSVYEIVSETGEGYLDSFAGFIFFLLIGKWFQQYTFYSISFDRNYRSYFPISALIQTEDGWQTKSLDKLQPLDILMIRNEEIIPGDGILQKGKATIDYSFVTGEAALLKKSAGDKIFAGGKNIGSNIQVQILQKIDQSYLTKLWDEDSFHIDKEAGTQTLIQSIGKYFTLTIMLISIVTLMYWWVFDKTIAFNAFTAVLIVACPCALALAIPFSYGNILRLLGKNSFYLKNVQVIDRMQQVDEIIFDKTGTITDHKNIIATNLGPKLTSEQMYLIKSATFASNHPLSKAIFNSLVSDYSSELDYFHEVTGQGIEAHMGDNKVRLGSASYIGGSKQEEMGKYLYVEQNDLMLTHFTIQYSLRSGVENLITSLSQFYSLSILSGDNDNEQDRLTSIFPKNTVMIFNQSPLDKLNYIKARQRLGHKVAMIGDGLNDSGALMQSEVGIVISEDSNNFTPACDAILNATAFDYFLNYLTFIRQAKWIIVGAFVIAFLYNIVGLFFAVRGELSPVIAAILMPLSSITVLFYGLVASKLVFNKYNKKIH